MSDRDFELRLQRVLAADADRAVRPFDALALAEAAVATGPATPRLNWRPAGWPMIRLLLIASILLLAAVATLWLVSGAPRHQGIVEAPPSTTPSDIGVVDQLVGSWIAPNPGNVVIAGEAITTPLLFDVGSNGLEGNFPIGSGRERVPSLLSGSGPGLLTFESRTGVTDEVTIAGIAYGACAGGQTGTYRPTRSADGLTLTFAVVSESCPSRQAMLTRTWTRYLGRPNSGGIGVVDAFDPSFVVSLPPGSYVPNHIPGSIQLYQAGFPEREFDAWKDPQGFNDPCDPAGKGRRPITNSADFVAYFRQLRGFTVNAVESIELDGRPATHLRVTANADASCPAGWLVEWQPKSNPSGPWWYLRPGDWDSLYLVDLSGTTLMFEAPTDPTHLDPLIIPTIRILEGGLPTSP